ncbi:MAG: extracellular solute-binding protein [Thermoleophilia bacterium]
MARLHAIRPTLRRVVLLGCASLLAVAAAGCGNAGSKTSTGKRGSAVSGFERTFAQTRPLTGAVRLRKLKALAAKEGKLTLYSSLNGELLDKLTGAFSDKYGVDVSVYRASDEDLARRLLEESHAGFHGADVVETNGPAMFALNDAHVLVPFGPAAASALVAGAKYPGWTTDRFNTMLVAWNTKRVSPGERPTRWEDLANPRWKGRIALEPGDFDWYKSLRDYWLSTGKTPAQADRLFAAIGRNGVVFKGHTLIVQLLGAGEFDLAASAFRHLVRNSEAAGAPVAWSPPVEPVFSRPAGVALVRGSEHPAAAMVFAEWLLSDGQELYGGLDLEPARADLARKLPGRRIVVDLRSLSATQQRWSDMYDRVVARAGGVGK